VDGRTDDVLSFPGEAGGLVQVHPVVFHQTLDLLDAAGWQIQQQKGGLRILVAAPARPFIRERQKPLSRRP
jgi:phenylacetate-CoA ligase